MRMIGAAPEDDEAEGRRRDLARHRAGATGLLALMALGLVAVRLWGGEGLGAAFARAAFEAALVGGLADWFAVTALFRRPLGLPIPHTAIVPRAQGRIADGLGRFVAQHFLDPALLQDRLKDIDVAGALARWLGRPAVADALAARVVQSLPVILNAVGDREIRDFLGEALTLKAARTELAPVTARLLRALVAAGEHGPVITALARMTRGVLEGSESAIIAEVAARSSWWVPRSVDRKLAESVIDGLNTLLDEIERPTSATRLRLDAEVEALVDRLEHDPATRAAFEAWKTRLLEQPMARGLAGRAFDALRSLAMEADATLTPGVARALIALGGALERDEAMRQRLNRRLSRVALGILVPGRAAIGGFITEVVRGWDPPVLTERLELSVGRDLQFIRVSGTLVGALVGMALFALQNLDRLGWPPGWLRPF